MGLVPPTPFELPDRTTALPRRPFEFSAAATAAADALIAAGPDPLYRALLRDQESEAVLLVARRVIDAFLGALLLGAPAGDEPHPDGSAEDVWRYLATTRAGLAADIATAVGWSPDARQALVRQRAPLGLLSGCWLDVLSQPATQPSIIVNRLLAQHFTLRGGGNRRRGVHWLRRHGMEEVGVYLPEITAADFLHRAGARPLTALHGCFYLALSRLPANFLPELVGVHCAFHGLGVDDLLNEAPPVLADAEVRGTLAAYLDLAGPAERERLRAGIRLGVYLEREHVALLRELSAWLRGQTLESKVAAIIAKHAPFAGRHHLGVRVGDRQLSDLLGDPGLDVAQFLREFRESRQLWRTADGSSRFLRALRLGGPMFGIFDEDEAAVFQEWAESVQAGERPDIVVLSNTVGDTRADAWRSAIAGSAPADVVTAEVGTPDDRELFHRLVNIENYPNTLSVAAERAQRVLDAAEILFTHGASGRYTDASYFEYSPEALYQRCERIYWDKLVRPYQPLETVPPKEEVVFLQTTYALGALVDGAWIHRVANLGRFERDSDGALFSIYADEMGHGDLRKNHITLIHRALRSMDIRLPHIREAAFMDQGDLPDELYLFSLFQLSLALFPDSLLREILGYNLAIEMFGLGELRLHEIQKLNYHGFDDCYERAHLTIDNLSAGHSRQAVEIIVSHLDDVARTLGDAAVPQAWRQVWRGYASLAYFVEHALVRELRGSAAGAGLGRRRAPASEPSTEPEATELLI